MQMAGKSTRCGEDTDHLLAVGHEAAPRGARRLDADADVGEGRLGEDRGGDAERDRDDDRAHAVGKQVARDDLAVRDADRLRGLDELGLLERQHLPADEPADGDPAGQADGHEDEQQAVHRLAEGGLAEDDRQQDDEEQVREGVDDVGEPHQEVVRAAAEPAGGRAERHADGQDDDLDDDRHGHADARPVEEPAEQVAPDLVGAQDVPRAERRQRLAAVRDDRL